jgi:uncharacterized protein (DUF305 family)
LKSRIRQLGAALAALLTATGAVAQGDSPAAPRHTAADVRFMQGMIAHHGQALEMVALIPGRTNRADFRLLGERIAVSQRDEIALMRRWLRARGEAVPDSGSPHMHHEGMDGMMPGMLTPAEMTALAASSGAEFERLFLVSMIKHHQGALMMVGELFGSRGAAQEPETFAFANDVDADQRAEIGRMQALLGTLTGAAPAH